MVDPLIPVTQVVSVLFGKLLLDSVPADAAESNKVIFGVKVLPALINCHPILPLSPSLVKNLAYN